MRKKETEHESTRGSRTRRRRRRRRNEKRTRGKAQPGGTSTKRTKQEWNNYIISLPSYSATSDVLDNLTALSAARQG